MQLQGTKIVLQKPKISALLQWFPALFYIANLYMRTGHSSSFYLISLCIVGILGLIKLAMDNRLCRAMILIVIVAYLLTGLINFTIIGNVNIRAIGNDMLLFGVMIMMFAYPMDYINATIFFYISIAVFIVAYFTGIQASTLLTSSGNYVSVLIILAAAIYYISLNNSGKAFRLIHVMPSFICLLLAVWAGGRGGILSCTVLFVLLIGYYLANYVRAGGARRYVFVLIVSSVVVIYLCLYSINFIDIFMSLGKWSSRGIDNTARELIWNSYFEKMDENLLYILNGAPLNDIAILQIYDNNTHNSFIQLHANNGLIMFVLFAFLMIKAFLYQIKNKQFLLLIILITVVIRGMTDKFIFGQYGMPIIMLLVLEPYLDRYDKKKLNADLSSGE